MTATACGEENKLLLWYRSYFKEDTVDRGGLSPHVLGETDTSQFTGAGFDLRVFSIAPNGFIIKIVVAILKIIVPIFYHLKLLILPLSFE